MKWFPISKGNDSKVKPSKFKVSLISAFLVLGLSAGPAQADHYRYVIAPLATVAALTYLFDQNHHQYQYSYKRKTHRSNRHGHQHGHNQHHRRKHSHSSGGYSNHSKKHYRH